MTAHRAIALVLSLLACAGYAQNAAPLEPGVYARLYDIGVDVAAVPDIVVGETPSDVLFLDVIDLKDGKFGKFTERFVVEIDGFLRIPTAGEHGFRLSSDDGSLLSIDGRLVVNNDGLHGASPRDGSIPLGAGDHAFSIRYFQGGGNAVLRLEWKPPGATAFALVPRDVLAGVNTRYHTEPGRKRIVAPLRRGKPGDGTPLTEPHPLVPAAALRANDEVAALLRDAAIRATHDTITRAKAPPVAWVSTGAVLTSGVGTTLSDGPLAGSVIVRDALDADDAKRIVFDTVDGKRQACVLRLGGYAAEAKSGPTGKPCFEIANVRAMSNGLEIEYSKPLDARCGWEPDAYYVELWPFDFAANQPPRRDGSTLPVKSASVSEDRRRAFLEIPGLKASSVAYVRVLPPCVSQDAEPIRSTEAWVTLHALPADRAGRVLPRPMSEPQNVLSDAEKRDGWKLLFDGKSTKGWRGFKKADGAPGWSAVDGCLVRTGPGGDIVTVDEYQDFELMLEWRISPAGNSGVFFRVSEAPPNNYVWETGPEMQVLDNAEHADGRNPLTSAASNYALHAPPKDVTRPVGFFNEARIVVNGPHVEYWLNGEKTVEYELGSAEWEKRIAASKFKDMPRYGRMPAGRIALQDHGDRVWYRNIRIRELK